MNQYCSEPPLKILFQLQKFLRCRRKSLYRARVDEADRAGKASDNQRYFPLMSRTTRYSHFGASVSAVLAERRLSQADLAEALGRSRGYLNQTMTGTKPASPEWADLVADTLKLSRTKRLSFTQRRLAITGSNWI